MSERSEKISQLYYRSNSIKFGSFRLSIHRDQPDLPESPWYLHYPKPNEAGSELLPELYDLIGQEFYAIRQTTENKSNPKRIAGLPKGALPLGDSFAKQYPADYPKNLLRFAKIEHPDGRLEFGQPEGAFDLGDNLEPVEDHVSGARNNSLFVAHARTCGFVVTKLMTVVDRQQRGPENLASMGVNMRSILTGDSLLEYGVAENLISQSRYDEVQAYRSQNQIEITYPI